MYRSLLTRSSNLCIAAAAVALGYTGRHLLPHFRPTMGQQTSARAYAFPASAGTDNSHIIPAGKVLGYTQAFNSADSAEAGLSIGNDTSAQWIEQQVPLLDCPDAEIERTYYFRWWTYRKHLRQTNAGWVVTEFLPDVPWAGKYNTICCAAGHHIMEGRWIHDPTYLNDYSQFWFHGGGDTHRYSFWAADAIYSRALVSGDFNFATKLLPDLVTNFETWQKLRQDPNGLFWQNDGEDGMEISIGGSGYRPTINSYMAADARAISSIARMSGDNIQAARFEALSKTIQTGLQKLWDPRDQFYKVLPRTPGATLAAVRELHGYTPWYFGLAMPNQAQAWHQIIDQQGFASKYGFTTAERRSPRFMFANTHECLWNGPVWPFASSITLTGMANMLNSPAQSPLKREDYFNQLHTYAASQRLVLANGKEIAWIDEDQDPDTGAWIARDILLKSGVKDRGKDYNHSTFCDLIISGLIGLRPRQDETVEINPLVPKDSWSYFCLDSVTYHHHKLTIVFDRDGTHYHREKGLTLYVDGKRAAHVDSLKRLTVAIATQPLP